MEGLTVDELIVRHPKLGLDSNVLIYLLDDIAPWADAVAELLGALEAGRATATLSALGLTEVLSGPARDGDLDRLERTNDYIRSLEGIEIAAIGADIAADAAVIRGVRGIGLADAVHLASARAAGATGFVTNDRGIRGSPKLEVVFLDDLV